MLSAEEQIVKCKIRVPSAAASNCLENPRLAARDLSRAMRSRKPIITCGKLRKLQINSKLRSITTVTSIVKRLCYYVTVAM